MKLFYAGSEPPQYQEILRKGNVENVLQSFFSLGMGKAKPINKEFPNYLLDSGGFSARMRGVEIDVKDFANYLNKYQILFAFNLDTNDMHQSLENQRYLDNHTNTYIIPVYHGVEWADPKYKGLLEYYIEQYPYIAVGGLAGREGSNENARRFLNYVFKNTKNNTMVHGLGVTSKKMLQTYPFYSSDSTSWMATARFGTSMVDSPDMAKVKARVRHYTQNLVEQIPYWHELELDVTRLWEARGIIWPDFNYEKIMTKRKKDMLTFKEWKEKNGK